MSVKTITKVHKLIIVLRISKRYILSNILMDTGCKQKIIGTLQVQRKQPRSSKNHEDVTVRDKCDRLGVDERIWTLETIRAECYSVY